MRVLLKLSILLLTLGGVSGSDLADSSAILADLSKYSKLYVTYQNCAWSAYDAGDGNGCGVQGGDQTYWYMGLTECFRANVAYSLYGVLQGEEDKGCTKNTFINSFFTTAGIESFVEYLTYAGATFSANADGSEITSDCGVVQGNDANNAAADYTANNVKANALDTSYGAGCADTDKGFVLKTYSGAYCDDRTATGVTDTLSTFNSEIIQVQCIAIYDTTAVAQDDQAQGQDNQQDYSALLQYSQACDVLLFPNQCPDPYGNLKSASRSSSSALSTNGSSRKEMVKTVFSWLLMGFGIVLMMSSAWIYYKKLRARDATKAKKNKNKRRNLFSRSRSQDVGDATKEAKKPGFLAGVRGMFSRNK